MAEQVPLGIADAAVPRGSHMCSFFSELAQRDNVVVPFLAEGIRSGQKCVAVLESPGPRDLLTRLGGQVNLGHSVETGQLELPAPVDAYLRSRQFFTEDMLDYWREVAIATQGAARFGFIRATGEMQSVLDHPDGRAEFFRCESVPAHGGHLRTPGSGRLPLRPGALRRGGTHGYSAGPSQGECRRPDP